MPTTSDDLNQRVLDRVPASFDDYAALCTNFGKEVAVTREAYDQMLDYYQGKAAPSSGVFVTLGKLLGENSLEPQGSTAAVLVLLSLQDAVFGPDLRKSATETAPSTTADEFGQRILDMVPATFDAYVDLCTKLGKEAAVTREAYDQMLSYYRGEIEEISGISESLRIVSSKSSPKLDASSSAVLVLLSLQDAIFSPDSRDSAKKS